MTETPPHLRLITQSDLVNKPPHYTAGKFETSDVIEDITSRYPPELVWAVGNVIKYLSRAPLKGNLHGDLLKAQAYLNRAVTKCTQALKQS